MSTCFKPLIEATLNEVYVIDDEISRLYLQKVQYARKRLCWKAGVPTEVK